MRLKNTKYCRSSFESGKYSIWTEIQTGKIQTKHTDYKTNYKALISFYTVGLHTRSVTAIMVSTALAVYLFLAIG